MTVAVTVLMAVHNGAAYLRETLESVGAQSFTDYEFLIVDDASQDATPAILAEAAAGDPRIEIHRNAKNVGLTKSLNLGLRQAAGRHSSAMHRGRDRRSSQRSRRSRSSFCCGRGTIHRAPTSM